MKHILTITVFAGLISAQAATVIYDFDSGLTGRSPDGISGGSATFVHGTNADSNANWNAQRAWYPADTSGDDVYYISARSSDNKGVGSANLDMTAGAPSYVHFELAPPVGDHLDFSAGTLELDPSLYRDNTTSFIMGYQVWADSGMGWTVVDALQTHSFGSGSGADAIYETDESTLLTMGNGMTAGSVKEEPGHLNFDLSSLGALTNDQVVTLAIALSGDRDNHANFGSSVDHIIVTLGEVVSTNHAPVARDDAYSLTRGEQLVVAEPGVLMNDTDPEGDAISAYLVSGVSSGSLTFNTNGSFNYVPTIGYTGTVSFTYAPVDGIATGSTVIVTIQVLEPIAVERPNILIFFADDMGRGDSRIYNTSSNLPPAQPTIEAFAASGMVFNDAHTQAALCAPSRYSILTGNYPWRGRKEGGSWHLNDNSQFMDG
jgi:hypothetical protein